MDFWRDPAYAAFWLDVARSDLAVWLQLTPYVYAVLEGVHLVGVALFFGSILLLDLRLLGLTPELPVQPVGRFLLRICAAGLLLLAVSGALMFVPSADRYAASPVFLVKMGALAAGACNALVMHVTQWRDVDAWERRARVPGTVRAAAVVSVLVWLGVIALGRAMGYERREPPQVDFELDWFAAIVVSETPSTNGGGGVRIEPFDGAVLSR